MSFQLCSELFIYLTGSILCFDKIISPRFCTSFVPVILTLRIARIPKNPLVFTAFIRGILISSRRVKAIVR